MKHPATQALYAHWQSICRGRRTPDRNDIDPVAIRSVLAYTFLLEVDAGRPSSRAYPIRVSGTLIDALFGRGVKGHSFLSLWSEADRVDVSSVIADVLDDAAPAVIGGRGALEGSEDVPLEFAFLPLRHRGLTHARLLCSLAPAYVPSWLGLEPVEPLRLTSWRQIDPLSLHDLQSELGNTSAIRRKPFFVLEGGKPAEEVNAEFSPQCRVKTVMSGC